MGGNLGAQIEKLRDEDENLRHSLGELGTHHTTQRNSAVDGLIATAEAIWDNLSTHNADLRTKLHPEAKSLRELPQQVDALDKELTMNIEERDGRWTSG